MQRSPHPKGRKAKQVIARRPSFQGWATSDEEEIQRRRWRGQTELLAVEAIEPAHGFFGSFRVSGASSNHYEVEIRSLTVFDNTCGCPDHQVNGLGTCKHIEGTLPALRRGRARDFDRAAKQGPARVEIYLSRRGDPVVRVLWPAEVPGVLAAALQPFFDEKGRLRDAPTVTLETLKRTLAALPEALRDQVRVSRHLDHWIAELRRRHARIEHREQFLAEVAAGNSDFDLLKLPLLPYQRDGTLHLAFGERALLADEMGLGKTAQAIAACELLRRRRGVGRVLVVCPASLKAEWAEQITRFTDLPFRIVQGSRAKRLHYYGKPAFFQIANYEQIIPDGPDINRILAPDVVILDEAQRIKNWQTKTARAVKGLKSPFAFVLTGTPLENRIDEIYSIVQYLDPGLLGPLFRFNRDFYELDERGRPEDYRNLEELHRRLKPVLLRRRKSDVEEQLPGRTVSNYFVAMEDEQRLRYREYEERVARLVAQARKRPLTQEEFEMLQRWLACMRMICDTPYILDQGCRICPKLEELEGILSDHAAEPDRKIIVFSEWVRMLELVRELAGEMGLEAAWHTGSVPQDRRRAEIRRFKDDPSCRLFLSSDAGSVGLNLQAASVVINLDLPWNPAKLEQRIARAWRKHQTRPVSVVNLVSEDSIEHRMLHLLAQKQGLADGVLDGLGDLKAIRMPSGRAAFIERLEGLMAAPAAPAEEIEDLPKLVVEDLLSRHGEKLLLVEARRDAAGRDTLLAVIDGDAADAVRESEDLSGKFGKPDDADSERTPRFEVLDRAGYAAIRRLIDTGLVKFAEEETRQLHRAAGLEEDGGERRRLEQARAILAEADRKLRMANLLAGGGFAAEARAPLSEALAGTLESVTLRTNGIPASEAAQPCEQAKELVERELLPREAIDTVATIFSGDHDAAPLDAEQVSSLIDSVERLLFSVQPPEAARAA